MHNYETYIYIISQFNLAISDFFSKTKTKLNNINFQNLKSNHTICLVRIVV